MRRLVPLAALAALATCADPPDPPVVAEAVALVWPIERGDVIARADAIASRLGLPAVEQRVDRLSAEAPSGRLNVDYATGRMTYHASDPAPMVTPDQLDDDALIDAAARRLWELGLLPPGTDACACAAGLTAGCPAPAADARSPWKTCDALAIRLTGIDSDLLPIDAELVEQPPPEKAGVVDGDGAPSMPAGEPIEIAFTPRLPIIRRVDGSFQLGEVAGGHADLVVRFDQTGRLEAIDDRFQPTAAEPIEVAFRPLSDVLAELQPDAEAPGPDSWSLGFTSRALVGDTDHGSIPHPLTFYHPLWIQELQGTNLIQRTAVASWFLPRILVATLPEQLDVSVDPPLAVWFDAAYGTGAPTVTWTVDDPVVGRRELATTTAVPDPGHPGTWKVTLDVPPPDGHRWLSLTVRDLAGVHYHLDDLTIAVSHSPTTFSANDRTSHTPGAWSDCGGLAFCHTDNIKVTAVCLAGDAECRRGPVGVTVDVGAAPTVRWNNVYIRDLVLMQFHLDLKLRLPEKKRHLANGWAEDWPLTGDHDVVNGSGDPWTAGDKFKELWIRTDTCKFDGGSTYACSLVPNGQSPTNPHRKMGMRCPAEYGHPKEQGTDANAQCTAPAKGPATLTMRRVFTGMPGRVTFDINYDVTEEATGPAMSPWLIDMASGTVIRLVKSWDETMFSQQETDRTAIMLKRIGARAPAVKPRVNWRWEGDRPRAHPEDDKVYGGMQVECYNALELCRQANGYDPRQFGWNHNGARTRTTYPEASSAVMPRPWERGQQASRSMAPDDRNEGDPFPYCPHQLYKVLKERFCPCPDDGTPCTATGGQNQNPYLDVVEVRMSVYQRMTPFESGVAGTTLVAEMKTLPDMMMGLEGHSSTKLGTSIPAARYFNNLPNQALSYAKWMAFLFPRLALGIWAAVMAGRVAFDAFTAWLDILHWYDTQLTMPIVRPLSGVSGLAPVNTFLNPHYYNALGMNPQWWWINPPVPPANIGVRPVPAAYNTQGFWQNLHFKSMPSDGRATPFYPIVVPGCQALFPKRIVANAQGGWYWAWDRSLCVHHHESWFADAPKQQNHDIAWIVGARQADQNPDRVGAVYPNTVLSTATSVGAVQFWEFTVKRTNANAAVETLNTQFFFTQGPDRW